jgi:hypothetical protein
LSTNISVIDEYHQSIITGPVGAFYVTGQPEVSTVPVEAPAEVEAPADTEEEVVEEDVEAKVVAAPVKRRRTTKVTEGAETK